MVHPSNEGRFMQQQHVEGDWGFKLTFVAEAQGQPRADQLREQLGACSRILSL